MNEEQLRQKLSGELKKTWRRNNRQIQSPNADRIRKDRGDSDFTLYQSTLQNAIVYSSLQRRWRLQVAQDWLIVPASDDDIDQQAAQKAHKIVENLRWNDVCIKMLYGMFWGWSAGEIFWAGLGKDLYIEKIEVLPRKYFGWRGDGQFAYRTGEPIPKERVWTYQFGGYDDDDPNGIGLAYWLYHPAAIMDGGMDGWMNFLEQATRPLPKVKYKGNNTEIQELATEIANRLFSGEPTAFNELFEADFFQATQGTKDYAEIVRLATTHIRQIVLLEDPSRDRASGEAVFRQQLIIQEQLIESDGDSLCSSFNQQVLARWCQYAFPSARPPRIKRVSKSMGDVLQMAQRDQLLANIGFFPTLERLVRDYGGGYERGTPIKTGSITDLSGYL